MGLPLLQIALDNQNIPDAITTIQQLGDVVDVVEVEQFYVYKKERLPLK